MEAEIGGKLDFPDGLTLYGRLLLVMDYLSPTTKSHWWTAHDLKPFLLEDDDIPAIRGTLLRLRKQGRVFARARTGARTLCIKKEYYADEAKTALPIPIVLNKGYPAPGTQRALILDEAIKILKQVYPNNLKAKDLLARIQESLPQIKVEILYSSIGQFGKFGLIPRVGYGVYRAPEDSKQSDGVENDVFSPGDNALYYPKIGSHREKVATVIRRMLMEAAPNPVKSRTMEAQVAIELPDVGVSTYPITLGILNKKGIITRVKKGWYTLNNNAPENVLPIEYREFAESETPTLVVTDPIVDAVDSGDGRKVQKLLAEIMLACTPEEMKKLGTLLIAVGQSLE